MGRPIQLKDIEPLLCGPVWINQSAPAEFDFQVARRTFTDAVEDIIAEKEVAERERQHIARAAGAAGRR